MQCPTCKSLVTIQDDYYTCGTCRVMNPVSLLKAATGDSADAAASAIIQDIDRGTMTNSSGQTIQEVKTAAAAEQAKRDLETEEQFYRELIQSAKRGARIGSDQLNIENRFNELLEDILLLKGATFVASAFEDAIRHVLSVGRLSLLEELRLSMILGQTKAFTRKCAESENAI